MENVSSVMARPGWSSSRSRKSLGMVSLYAVEMEEDSQVEEADVGLGTRRTNVSLGRNADPSRLPAPKLFALSGCVVCSYA